nr:MAG TPA: hypothetical protein [Caudoviricetes sp.]
MEVKRYFYSSELRPLRMRWDCFMMARGVGRELPSERPE